MDRFQIKGAPVCRVVYPAGLFEKKAVKGVEGDPKYNAIILVPKTDEDKVKQINDRFAEAFAELQSKGFKGKNAKAINPKNNCWVDGDEFADMNDGKEAFRGYMMLKVASKNFRPLVSDMQRRMIINGVPMPNVSWKTFPTNVWRTVTTSSQTYRSGRITTPPRRASVAMFTLW